MCFSSEEDTFGFQPQLWFQGQAQRQRRWGLCEGPDSREQQVREPGKQEGGAPSPPTVDGFIWMQRCEILLRRTKIELPSSPAPQGSKGLFFLIHTWSLLSGCTVCWEYSKGTSREETEKYKLLNSPWLPAGMARSSEARAPLPHTLAWIPQAHKAALFTL